MSLPRVPDVTRLGNGIIRILGQNGPSKFVLQGTNTYLIGTGRRRILIDTAEGHEAYIALLSDVLRQESCTISQILLTHWHHDHVDGVPAVLELVRSTGENPPVVSKYPHESDEGDWQPLADGANVSADDGVSLTAIHTPGHASDHLAFHLPSEGYLFTADHILGGSTTVFEDLAAYMASLEKVRLLQPKRLLPGHGLDMDDGTAVIEQYIAHRQQREDQIVNLLQQATSPMTAMDIVKVIYKDVREDLHVAAVSFLLLIVMCTSCKCQRSRDGRGESHLVHVGVCVCCRTRLVRCDRSIARVSTCGRDKTHTSTSCSCMRFGPLRDLSLN